MVYGAGIFEEDEVEPAAAAFAACCDAVFAAEALEGFAVFLVGVSLRLFFPLGFWGVSWGGIRSERGEGIAHVELFCGEWTTAYAGCVRFDDANDFFDFEGGEGEAGEDSADSGGGGCDERVGAVVDVEHQGVAVFELVHD